jgi:nucleoside 2-deoxyribosyltransferase
MSVEKNIRDADACLADISRENPNVWYEVGYAIASGKEIVLVCMEGSKFPFDVRHRSIIVYKTESTRDFDKLKSDITNRLNALAKKRLTIEEISPVKPTHGLTSPEMGFR